jgi:cyclic 2,3-diphosphoglycerate synthetase
MLSREGRHAASDYLEDAALAGVVTIGCRRCGGGLAGMPAFSNVEKGARLAAERAPELVIFEGSGSAIPPVATGKRVLVAGAHQEPELVTGYLNAYRILVSDLVVLTMCEEGTPYDELRRRIAGVNEMPVVPTVLRPRPLGEVAGRRVAYFTTAPPGAQKLLSEHLRTAHGADIAFVSGNLASREALRDDLAALPEVEAFLIEIKAAAIDVVAETAAARGVETIFVDNEVLALPGGADLDAELRALADAAVKEPVPS